MPLPNTNNELNRVSARQFVYNGLKNWIIDGTMLPGEFINDNEIARHFAVSRTPVREAILMLANQDLVKIIPSKGTQITPVTPQQATYVFEAIACLAKEVARLAVKKHTPGDVIQLKKLNQNFKNAVSRGINSEIAAADRDFHRYILKMADNPYLENSWNRIIPHAYRYEMLYFKDGMKKDRSVTDHENIISAIADCTSDRAAEASRHNWTGFFENVLKPRLIEEKDVSDFLLYHKYY